MEFIENILMTKIGAFLVMTFVVLLFIGVLRFFYGPNGIWRKSLWDTHQAEKKTKVNTQKNEKKDLF